MILPPPPYLSPFASPEDIERWKVQMAEYDKMRKTNEAILIVFCALFIMAAIVIVTVGLWFSGGIKAILIGYVLAAAFWLAVLEVRKRL